jgi:hypothetical protein
VTDLPEPSQQSTPQTKSQGYDAKSDAGSDSDLTAGKQRASAVSIVWAIACVLIVCIVSGVYLVDRTIKSAHSAGSSIGARIDSALNLPLDIADRLAGAFRTQTVVNTVFIPVIQEIKEKPKFVVMTSTLNVTVKKESIRTTMWGAVDLGTTTVTLRANGNRVQYYVPLDGAGMDNFVFDPKTKTLVATFPKVQVDREVVDVQSDPEQIDMKTDVGWARLDRYSGEELRGQARKDLRVAVLEEAGTPLLMDKARETARKHLTKMLEPVQLALREDVKLVVRFEDEPEIVQR